MEGTQQSKMITQRQNDGPSMNFELQGEVPTEDIDPFV
jgi:hypothetical protein